MKTEILSKNTGLILLLLLTTSAFSQTPDSALWESSSKYIFSSAAFPQKTGEFTVTFFDDNGNPVPENTPVAFSINYGKVEGPTLFKMEESGNVTGGGAFYFKTNALGRVTVDYIPDYTPRGIRSFQNQYPDSSLNFIWGKHDEQNELSYYTWSSLLLAVNIPNPEDEQSAQIVANIPLKKASITPVLMGPSYAVVTTKSKHNDEYIFTASGVTPEKAELTITIFDGEENPVPAGTPFGIRLNHPGKIPTEQVIQEPESENSSLDYILIAGENGQLVFDYLAPQMVPPPFSDWYAGSVFETFDYSKEDAWEFYKKRHWEIDEGYDGKGYAAIDEISGVNKNSFDPDNLILDTETLEIDETQSIPPVLVGPDKIFIGTTSRIGDEYIFTSALHAESADIYVSVVDSRGRAVPEGTPIALALNSLGLVSIRGKLTGNNIFQVVHSASNNDNIFDPTFTTTFFRLGEEGVSNLTYIAPYVNLAPKRLHNSQSFTYDESHRGLGLFAMPAQFNCGVPCQFPDNIHWNVDASLQPSGPIITAESGSKVPIVIGPDSASIIMKPTTITSGDINASIKGIVFDSRGIPVPSNTNITIIPSTGNVPDAPAALRLTTGDNGEVFGEYKTNTRPIGQSKTPVTISMYTPDNTGNPDGWLLGQGTVFTEGGAVNKATHKYGQYLLGLSITETVQGLNPLKAYGSLKRFNQRVENVGHKYRKLLDNYASGNASASDFDEYQQAWGDVQSSFHQLIQDVPGTSITGPGGSINVGGVVKELTQVGFRRALINTARTQILGKSLKKTMSYSVDVFVQEQFLGLKKTVFGVSTSPVPYYGDTEPHFTSDLFSLPSETGIFEVYGFEFEIHNADTLIANGTLQVEDKAPIFENILPGGVSVFGLSAEGVLSPGIFEVTEIDVEQGVIRFAALLFASNPIMDDQDFIVDAELGIESDTLEWLKGTRLIFQDSTVLETDNYFFGTTVVPHPFIEAESTNIDQSYVVGSFAPDSSIQNITFNKPAFIQIVDSVLASDYQAYSYDEDTYGWEVILSTTKSGDTLTIPVAQTSIVGLGMSTESLNEPPFLSSVADTSVEKGASFSVPLKFSDLNQDQLTVTVSSDTSAVVVSLDESILSISMDADFTGMATIMISVSDGINISSTKFRVYVEFINQLPIIAAIKDTSTTLGSSFTIQLEVSDPDGQALSLGAASDTSGLSVSLDGFDLTISPEPTFLGEAVITVFADDGFDEVSASFTVTVKELVNNDQTDLGIPEKLELSQNYPNPFNPSTTISFGVPASSRVELLVYDVLGRKVATLIDNELKAAGIYSVRFDASSLSSGMYIYQLKTDHQIITKKLMLIK
ncbi:MAG: T9SS type A sorting domain-containing protein [Balneolaceae bacterium]|nr:T9SS type A sorting domain-containing protein [Balneolaceae bacterium]MBO6546086.1 T9SS type A sorting domain-containing protein [Balneolaceae bacterium]MBO6647482.1 T9SS type A sorting domain-containing protein [Balneolaceae bacterium]